MGISLYQSSKGFQYYEVMFCVVHEDSTSSPFSENVMAVCDVVNIWSYQVLVLIAHIYKRWKVFQLPVYFSSSFSFFYNQVQLFVPHSTYFSFVYQHVQCPLPMRLAVQNYLHLWFEWSKASYLFNNITWGWKQEFWIIEKVWISGFIYLWYDMSRVQLVQVLSYYTCSYMCIIWTWDI